MKRSLASSLFLVLAGAALTGCAYESHQTVATPTVESEAVPYTGPRHAIALGSFQNTSPYLRGIFSDGQDRLGNQARTILKTHLSKTQRFDVLDRENLEAMKREAELTGVEQQLEGAHVVLGGQVTEFGRKETGGQAAFGILGRGRTQTAYSKVSINVVDVTTSRIVHSVQGAGEYSLSTQEVVGFGSSASYDSTLNGKVLNLAITDAVNKLVADLEAGRWQPE